MLVRWEKNVVISIELIIWKKKWDNYKDEGIFNKKEDNY